MKKTTNLLNRYVRVSEDYVCPVCGHDNWCLVNQEGTGAICCREQSDSPRGEAGHFHWLDGSDPPPVEATPRRDLIPKARLATFQPIWEKQLTPIRAVALSIKLGLSVAALKVIGTGWRGDCYTFPMYTAGGEITGYRLRSPKGSKWTLGGTENGIFMPKDLPRCLDGIDDLHICEGPTDLAAAWDLGYQAIGRPNNISLKDETKKLIVQLRPSHATIVADGDTPGIEGAKQFRDWLAPEIDADVYAPIKHKDLREYVAHPEEYQLIEHSNNWKLIA